jgi:hypothetical protein
MDNNDPVVQSHYTTHGVTYDSSTAAGNAEAAVGYQQCSRQQPNETLGAAQTREAAFNNARKASGN